MRFMASGGLGLYYIYQALISPVLLHSANNQATSRVLCKQSNGERASPANFKSRKGSLTLSIA